MKISKCYSSLVNLVLVAMRLKNCQSDYKPCSLTHSKCYSYKSPPQLWFFFNQTFSKNSLWESSQKLLFLKIPCESPHKSYFLAFWNFKFQIFFKRLKFLLTWDPMGVKISKRYSSYSYYSFSTKLFQNVPCDSPHKSYIGIWKFEI